MKLFFLFVFVLGVSADTFSVQKDAELQGFAPVRGISDIIAGIIKTLLDQIKTVIPEPLTLPKLNISLPYENLANGSFILEDTVETGAQNFNATNVTTNIITSDVNVVLDFPSINVNTNYWADLLLGSILPLYGEGPANIRLKNLRLNLTSKYTLNIFKLQMQIKNTSLLISLGDAVFDIHGMINNEAFSVLCSQILDDTVDTFINKHNVLISKIISPAIEVIVNKILAGGGEKKVMEGVTFQGVSTNLKEGEILKLRQMFFDEIVKHPQVSKFIAT